MQWRTSTGGSTVTSPITLGDGTNPKWIKLVRSGNSFSGYYSIDGVTWSLIVTQTVNMTADTEVGLAVTSHRDVRTLLGRV